MPRKALAHQRELGIDVDLTEWSVRICLIVVLKPQFGWLERLKRQHPRYQWRFKLRLQGINNIFGTCMLCGIERYTALRYLPRKL